MNLCRSEWKEWRFWLAISAAAAYSGYAVVVLGRLIYWGAVHYSEAGGSPFTF